jgi:hypothetical protein
MIKRLLVVSCLVMTAPRLAAAEKTVYVETNGVEVALPVGWKPVQKGAVTLLAPEKFKGRAVEIIKLKAMPPSTVEGLQKELGAKFKVTVAKEGMRDGGKVVVASAKATIGKEDLDVDMLAVPVGTGAIALISYTRADSDPVVRESSIAILASARVAGPKLTIEYTAPTTKGLVGPPEDFVEAFRKMAPKLDALLLFPRALPVKFETCKQINAFYQPSTHSIRMCHELYDDFVSLYTNAGVATDKATQLARSALFFTFFHEFGHALAGELELPITAKGEDAADELATLMMTVMGEPGKKAALAAAQWFAIEAANGAKAGRKHNFLDEHSVDEQRMGSITCLLYGGNKAAYEPLMKKLGFDARRLAKCTRDYQARYKAWNSLLEPHHRKRAKK